MKGKTTRPGLYKCRDCQKPFTATIGTLYERPYSASQVVTGNASHVRQQKGNVRASALPDAWFRLLPDGLVYGHGIRAAMPEDASAAPIGGQNKVVEIDETYVGGKERNRHRSTSAQQGHRRRVR